MTVLDIIGSRLSADCLLILVSAVLTACKSTVVAACISIRGAVFLFFHDLFISLLDFLELLFRLFFVWIIDICIRMIFPAQFPVCLFDFFIGCIPGNAKDTVWIKHFLSPALSSSYRTLLQICTRLRNTEYSAVYRYI